MAQWLMAWAGYYGRLWQRGLVVAVIGAIVGAVLAFASFLLVSGVARLFGWSDAAAWDWFKFSGVVWLPLAAGAVMNMANFSRLPSPPGWVDYRLGLPLRELPDEL